MRLLWIAAALAAAGCASSGGVRPPPIHVIAGSVPIDRGPDGNSIFINAPEGLILVDTGRHPEHAAKLLAYAKERGRPIAAIVNTHWHLDHTTGNHDIARAYPDAPVFATKAIEGALVGFLNRNRDEAERRLADPDTPAKQKAQIARARSVIDNPERLRPTRPVSQSRLVRIAGRDLELRTTRFAVTESDLWLYDPATRTAIVGDLVVDIVPFMDTACADGWLAALDDVERTAFETLIPGHGPAMTRADFTNWKSAFTAFVRCGRSEVAKEDCVAGWERNAAQFIPQSHRQYVREAADYYITTRLRSSTDEQQRYCRSLLPQN